MKSMLIIVLMGLIGQADAQTLTGDITTSECKVVSGAPCPPPPFTHQSSIGASIEVESYRCTVKSEYKISCQNIGPICRRVLAEKKKTDDYYFGCELDAWKAMHPQERRPEYVGPSFIAQYCMPTEFGAW